MIHAPMREKVARVREKIREKKSPLPIGKGLIFYQILATDSLRKCMDTISLENLYMDIEA